MTWSASIPDGASSPSLFPTEAQTNWSRLQSIITADHLFSTSSSSDQGYHKIVHWVNQGGDLGDNSPAPATGVGQLYTKTVTTTGDASSTAGSSEHLCYQPGTDGAALREASLSACPVRAAVSFRGQTSNGACTVYWGHNVSGVSRTASGQYTISFTTDLPSIYYVPVITCSGGFDSSGGTDTRAQAQLYTDTTHSNVFAVGSLKVSFFRDKTSNTMNPYDVSIVIYGG